jgi:hypothetical protein
MLAKLLTQITTLPADLTAELSLPLLKHHLTEITEAADALVWIMRAARDPKFMQNFGDFATQTLDEIFTRHPSLVIKKLSFAVDFRELKESDIPKDGGFPGSGTEGDKFLPQEEGVYDVREYMAKPISRPGMGRYMSEHLSLETVNYRNYNLLTPWQFANLFQLKPFQDVLEKHKVNKTILAKEDQFAPTRINPLQQKKSVGAQVRVADLKDIPKLIRQDMSDQEALEALLELLQKARFDPTLDKPISEFIEHLHDDHPFLNINHLFAFAKDKKKEIPTGRPIYLDELFEIMLEDRKLPQDIYYEPYSVGSRTMTYHLKFYLCSPLRIAAIYNLKAIMKVLLDHRAIDLTVDPVYSSSSNAESKKILHEAAIKQFYGEALLASPDEKDKIVEKFDDFHLTPSQLRDYALKQITSRVEAVKDPVQKLQILNTEISKLPSNNALAEFLGDERKTLEKNLLAEVGKIQREQATAAPPTRATMITTQSINSMPKDLERSDNTNEQPATSGLKDKLSRFFTRK